MKRLLSIHLAFLLLLSSLAPLGALAQGQSCENGECIPKLVDRLEDLGALYQNECLPGKNLSEAEIAEHYDQKGISEQCWKYITEIGHLEDELQKHQAKLEARLGCESGDCKHGADSLNAQLKDLGKVEEKLSCTEPKKRELKNQCGNDLKCTLYASAMGIGGYLAEKMIPDRSKIKGCHLGDDSCSTQLATGFLKAVISFFEGAWDLLKAGGKYVGKKAGELWDWVKGGDDHASTSQLAMAKASENEGVFDMLMNDFSGTMVKLFEGLVAALKEWMKTDIFCQKWQGAPRFSKCLQPTDSFDCISCKAMVNGVCAISGVLIAEIVPAFLTGGLATAAKHGVNGAAKIAKLFKVSDKAMDAIKASRAAKIAVSAATKVDDVLKVSKGLKIAKEAVEVALKAIKAYLLSPARKVLKASHSALLALSKKGSVFLAETKTGKVLLFSAKAAKATGKVLIYPIDNPMTVWAFKAGERSFEKVLRLGAPKLAATSAVTSALVKSEPALESSLAKLEAARRKYKPTAKPLLKLEEENYEMLTKISPNKTSRGRILPDPQGKPLNEPLNLLTVDELNALPDGTVLYDIDGKKVIKGKDHIDLDTRGGFVAFGLTDGQIASGQIKGLKSFRTKLAEEALAKKYPSMYDIIRNLYPELHYGPLAQKLGPEKVLLAEKELMELLEKLPEGALKEKLLKQFDLHVSKGAARKKIVGDARPGGQLRPEDAFPALKVVKVPEVNVNQLAEMMSSKEYQGIINVTEVPQRKATARSLKLLEDSGLSRAEAAAVYKRHEKYFKHVQGMAKPDSDAQALLAEFIRRERKAGVADDVIDKKLGEAFKDCN